MSEDLKDKIAEMEKQLAELKKKAETETPEKEWEPGPHKFGQFSIPPGYRLKGLDLHTS